MTDHARTVGGPALRALTFHERAGAAQGDGQAPHRAQGRALRALGPHRRDQARLGGRHRRRHRHGLLLRLQGHPRAAQRHHRPRRPGRAARPRRAPSSASTSTPRGPASPCRSTRSTSRSGASWRSWLRRSSPGCRRIVKPASQTAYLTELVVRRIIESGLLPEGTLQLLCGSPAGLLEELGAQDSVAFTGSAATGAHLRQHPSVLHGGVRLGVEADSLNCSILGPDVTADDPEFDLFVKGVVTEMTVKAGQKCTAIRRTIVPAAIADEVTDAIAARLAKITVGNPANDDVRMGALASLDQREEVRKAVQALRGSAEIVFGDPDTRRRRRRRRRARRVHVAGAAAGRRRSASEPHDVEAFGPVSTVLTLRRPRRGHRPRRPRLRLARRLAGHPRPGRRPHGDARPRARGTAASSCSTATTPASPPATARRCRCSCTAAPAAPAAARSSAASAACCTTCSAPRSRPRPTCSPRSPGSGPPARTRTETDVHPFRKSLADLAIGDTISSAAADGHPRRHRALRGVHRRHLLRPHRRGGRREEPAVRRDRRPRLPDRLAGRRAVRRPEPGPGARQLRRRQPAVPHPGQGRRLDRGDADRQADHPAHERRLRRGPVGRASSPTARATPSRRTTC